MANEGSEVTKSALPCASNIGSEAKNSEDEEKDHRNDGREDERAKAAQLV